MKIDKNQKLTIENKMLWWFSKIQKFPFTTLAKHGLVRRPGNGSADIEFQGLLKTEGLIPMYTNNFRILKRC